MSAATIAAMSTALTQAATRFREYERHHSARAEIELVGSDASERKAQRNREMAELCEAAVAKAGGR